LKKWFDTLRPFEKRVVVGVAAMFFVVMNFWFVFPHFSDLGNLHKRMLAAQAKQATYQAMIDKTSTYEKMTKSLQGGGGLEVPREDQANQFSRTILMQAGQSGVAVPQTGKMQATTNLFFLELSQSIGVQSGEKQLVDFLYNLGSGETSQIRVRDMSLHPDSPRQQLQANVKLIASYQKTVTKAAAPGTRAVSANSPSSTPK
jgi:hypothetical protein